MIGKNRKRGKREAIKESISKDNKLREQIDELATGDRREVDKADMEVQQVVTRAAQTELKDILIIDQGRCPRCHARTENFLFTMVCPSCGWFRREVPSRGHSVVSLRSGQEIECDYVHHSDRDEILCIRDGVVISEVMRSEIRHIDHRWGEGELDEARTLANRLKTGICSWCNQSIDQTPEEEHGEDYVAFGAFQERYIFCSEKCQRAFRRHYPARVHRNCYETDCNTCNLCIKRFDTHGFKRNILK